MEEFIKTVEARTRELSETLKRELLGFRTNRPVPQLLENIPVEYAGQTLTIKQVGSLTVVPPRELQVQVWDVGAVTTVAKAIETAKVGLMPTVQGNVIRVFLPPMSDERREELTRLMRSLAEKFRIQLRALRDEANKKVEGAAKQKEINEDYKFKLKERIQKAVDVTNKDIETLVEHKIQEIRE